MLLNVFRDFPKENREKLQKHSKKKPQNIRKSFIFRQKNRAKIRNVKRDLVAMQQDVLLYNWAFFLENSLK